MRRLLLTTLCALAMAAARPAAAERAAGPPDLPVLLTADEVSYDREHGIVRARGHVEISRQGRVLLADEVTYNQKTKVVMAIGHVSLTEPTGEVAFADRLEITDDLKNGVVTNFRLLFPDETRLAANDAQRTGGVRTEMNRAVFSPCKLCKDDPTRPPLWQLKARKIVHDKETRDIEYFDATLEMFGVPVAYTPYFVHPDPTVDRRTGFLAPSYGSDSQLGILVKTPFFITLGPDKDITIEPIFTSKERVALGAEYRQRVKNGAFQASGSFTRVRRRDINGERLDDEQNRGHIFAKGLFDIDETWRWGFDAGWTTDDTYLRRYDITSTDVITSTAFVEGFRGRNYASVRGFHFQGLREEDDYDTTPIVAPLVDYNLVSGPLGPWGHWSLDANAMVLSRIEGADSRRLSVRGKWELPYTGALGDITTLSAGAQGDVYWVNSVRENRFARPPGNFSGVTGRFFPYAMVDWRFPLVREIGNVRQLLEPRVAVIVSPNGNNPDKIPNEDSQDFEFDDINLWSVNKFPGVDRVSGGQWLVYGISTAFYGDRGGKSSAFIGQTLRVATDDTFGVDSGLQTHVSDVVGRVNIEPADYFQLSYRFRLNQENFRARRNEVTANFGPRLLRLSVNYLFFANTGNNPEFPDREEISASARSQLSNYWSLHASTRHDLTETGGVLSNGVGVAYEDECFSFGLDLSRNFTRDRDVKATTRVFVQVVFKRLGQARGGAQ